MEMMSIIKKVQFVPQTYDKGKYFKRHNFKKLDEVHKVNKIPRFVDLPGNQHVTQSSKTVIIVTFLIN